MVGAKLKKCGCKTLAVTFLCCLAILLFRAFYHEERGMDYHTTIKENTEPEKSIADIIAHSIDFFDDPKGDLEFSHNRAKLSLAGDVTPRIHVKTNPRDGPGEMGKAVVIDESKLDVAERKKYQDGYKANAFNQFASDLVSVRRTLPDVRDIGCKRLKYDINSLPDVSVIICFHDEAWSTLLRTVYSVIDRSSPQLLKEIILVDDDSHQHHLKEQLDVFIRNDEILRRLVRVVRTTQREGLVRARLLGVQQATGSVLVFLDSHCECTIGWLEPLAYRIQQNRTNVVTPVIDIIHDATMAYIHDSTEEMSVGGFDWNLQYTWQPIPDREQQRRSSYVDPVRTPTMAGGLFAISREYFHYLGTYDNGMNIWGGENLEISFRIWMCGGNLEIHPCSRVGHIFRKRNPYTNKVCNILG